MASSILPVTRNAGVPLVINDHPDIAVEVGAEFCHLGQEDFFREGRTRISDLPVASPGLRAWIQGNVQAYTQTYENDPRNGVLYPYNTSLGIYKCPASRAFIPGVGRSVTVPHNRAFSVSVWLGGSPELAPEIAQKTIRGFNSLSLS